MVSCPRTLFLAVAKLVPLATVIFLVSSCGGGGGGAATSPPDVGGGGNTGPVAPSGQTLRLVGLSLSAGDVIANTAPSTTAAKADAPAEANSAPKSDYPPAQTQADFLASRSLVNGQLMSLNPVVKYYETNANGVEVERTIECDFSTAEVSIQAIYLLNEDTGDVLAVAEVPDTINQGCIFSYGTAILVVRNDGTVFEISSGLNMGFSNIVPANLPGFNQSNSPLIIDGNGDIYVLEFPEPGQLTMTALTTSSAPVNVSRGGFAFDGYFLVGVASSGVASTATFFIYERGSTAFRIFRPDSAIIGSSNLTTILDEQGRFLVHNQNSIFHVLNPVDLTYPPLIDYMSPSFSNYCLAWEGEVGYSQCLNETFPSNYMHGAAGRYGSWWLSERGMLWNYDTYVYWCLWGQALNILGEDIERECHADNGKISREVKMAGQFAYTVNVNSSIFTRFDIANQTGTVVDLDPLGYLTQSYTIFKDLAFVEITNSANSDKMYVEINFDTGEVIDRGVITQGSRAVVSFTPISG